MAFITKLGKTALKAGVGKAYLGAYTALSPSFKQAKAGARRAKGYIPSPAGAGLYAGGLLLPAKVAKYSYKLSQIYGSAEVPIEIVKIISKAYRSNAFYKARWRIKAGILAKRIIRNPKIQRNIAEAGLAEIIYQIMKRHKNRQGNEELAREIAQSGAVTIIETGGI